MNIQEFRQQYPQYNDMSDADLAKTMHQKYYSDMPENEFNAKFLGTSSTQPSPAPKTMPDDTNMAQKALIGLGRGLTDVGEGLKQAYLSGTEALGLQPKGTTQAYTTNKDEERRFYAQTPVGQSTTGAVGRFAGNVLPYTIVPGGMTGGLLTRMGTGALAGAGMGATTYAGEGDSRGFNTLAGGLLGAAAPAITTGVSKAYNAIKGNFADDAAKAVVDLGQKFNVPVNAADAAQTPGLKGTAIALENMPAPLSIKPDRIDQLTKAKTAAENMTSNLEDKMLNTNFGGKTGLKELQQAANSNNQIRANAAKNLLNDIQSSGDDWSKIIETSGNLKLFRSKLIADQKYNKLSKMADQYGAVPKQNTLNAIDNAIQDASQSVLPDRNTIQKLQDLKNNFASRDFTYSQLRNARGEIGGLIDDIMKGNNAAVGSRDASYFSNIKNAIGNDLNNFAQNNGSQLKTLWKNADSFYQRSVAPYKDVQLAKALTNNSPDEIYSKFITTGAREGGKGTSRAQRFYNALDDKGRAAVRYGIVSDALEKSIVPDTNRFSPAIFANKLDETTAARGVFFKGQDKAEINGFKNLMRHIDRAGVAANKPETGVKFLPMFLSALGAGGLFFNPVLTGIAGATGFATRKMLTSEAGKKYLLAASKIKPGSPAMQKIVDQLEQTAQRAITVSGTNAQQRARDEMNQGR